MDFFQHWSDFFNSSNKPVFNWESKAACVTNTFPICVFNHTKSSWFIVKKFIKIIVITRSKSKRISPLRFINGYCHILSTLRGLNFFWNFNIWQSLQMTFCLYLFIISKTY